MAVTLVGVAFLLRTLSRGVLSHVGFRVKTHVFVDSAMVTPCAITLPEVLSWSSGALGFGLVWSGIPESMLVSMVVLFCPPLSVFGGLCYSVILGFSL
jgi:hypothetical protein